MKDEVTESMIDLALVCAVSSRNLEQAARRANRALSNPHSEAAIVCSDILRRLVAAIIEETNVEVPDVPDGPW